MPFLFSLDVAEADNAPVSSGAGRRRVAVGAVAAAAVLGIGGLAAVTLSVSDSPPADTASADWVTKVNAALTTLEAAPAFDVEQFETYADAKRDSYDEHEIGSAGRDGLRYIEGDVETVRFEFEMDRMTVLLTARFAGGVAVDAVDVTLFDTLEGEQVSGAGWTGLVRDVGEVSVLNAAVSSDALLDVAVAYDAKRSVGLVDRLVARLMSG
jgi:hypothetical protein